MSRAWQGGDIWCSSRFPFYWEIKTIFLLFLSLPQTQVSAFVCNCEPVINKIFRALRIFTPPSSHHMPPRTKPRLTRALNVQRLRQCPSCMGVWLQRSRPFSDFSQKLQLSNRPRLMPASQHLRELDSEDKDLLREQPLITWKWRRAFGMLTDLP
jgi:Zn-finger nucleic acid-binding protein